MGVGVEERWIGSLGSAGTCYFICGMYKQVPTVLHRGLYSIFCDKPQREVIYKRIYMYV